MTTLATAATTGREHFQVLTADMWAAFRWVRDREVFLNSREESIAHLTEEAAARNLMTRYLYALGADDVALAASLFTADATADGSSDVQATLERWNTGAFSRPRIVNYIVRITPGGEEVWLVCYLHQPRVQATGEVDSRFFRCLGRLEKQADGWKIADWYASLDIAHRFGTEAQMVAAGPQVIDRVEQDRASRALTKHSSPAIDGGRDTWNELREDVWEAHHWFADQPETAPAAVEEQIACLVDELQLRELLANYAFAHDSRDLLWSGSVFADDAILINNIFRSDSNAQVIEAFRGFNRRMAVSFHRFGNPRFKFVPGRPEAWFVAYYHVATIAPDGYCQQSYGRYFGRLTKQSGRWQIADWRIANDPSVMPMEPGIADAAT